MIDFDKIPTNEDWDNLIPGKYYPDNEYESFYGKSFNEIVDDINNLGGMAIIFSLGSVSSDRPFYFYATCILHAMRNRLIKPYNDSGDCFYAIISSIDTKITHFGVFYKDFINFVEPIKEILSGILDSSLTSDYDEEELAEIEERALALIAEIERRYAECIAVESTAASMPDKKG